MDNSLSQPYEVKSFEGGITDFFLQAPNTYYERADNFVVNNDLKLEVRWGSFLWDALRGNHIIDSANPRRIDNFLLFRDESILLAKSGRDVYYQAPSAGAWTKLVGPTGNEVYSEGGFYSFATQAQWNGHIFTTNTAGSLPSKIYEDETGQIVVRSVGLPYAQNPAVAVQATTLSACIALANDLRASMLNHFLDGSYDSGTQAATTNPGLVVPPNTGTALHFVRDHGSATYLATQTGPIAPAPPSPLPTPAPAATDLTSLYTLIVALCKAQQAHIIDANTFSTGAAVTGQIHYMNRIQVPSQNAISGPNVAVTSAAIPTTLEEARTRLNDLRKFWDWHRLAVNTHIWTGIFFLASRWQYGAVTSFPLLNRYPLSSPLVPDPAANGAIVATANFGKFIGYVNTLKYLYNTHTSNGYYMSASAGGFPSGFTNFIQATGGSAPHARNPGATLYELPQIPELDAIRCELPDATDFNSACLTLYWIRALYSLHNQDAARTTGSVGFTFTGTTGANTITSVANLAGAAITLPVGLNFGTVSGYMVVGNGLASGPYGENGGVIITASASGTATLSKNISSGFTGMPGMYSSSRFHYAATTGFGGAATGSSSPLITSDESLQNPAAVGAQTQDWMDLATEFFLAMNTHSNNSAVHNGVFNLSQAAAYYTAGPVDSLDPAVGSFDYAIIYKLTYTSVDGVEFIEFSNPVQIGAEGYPINYPLGYSPSNEENGAVGSPFANVISPTNVAQYGTVITGIPVLANTSKTNYDLTKIVIQLYRTIDTGTTYYLLAELPNGTTSYVDTTNDTLSDSSTDPLNTRETLYTTGGIVGFDPPPRAKFIHILENTAIYGGTYDGDQFFPNRLLQSIPGTPAATNLTFYDDLDEAVTGISSTGGNFVAFTLTKSYRLGGGYNELGQGNLSHERISDNVGCIGEASIVQTDLGIYFAGNDGFYFTDGYTVVKISAQIDKTFQKYTQAQNQRDRIVGTYDRQFRRIYWTMQADPTGADCGHLFILHTGYSDQKTNGVFTTWTNGNDFMPSAVTYYKNQLIRGDFRGVVYAHSNFSKTDPAVPVDLTLPAAQWNTSYLPYLYKSAAMDFNSIYKGQWATRIHLAGRNVGNAGIQISTVREINNENARNLSPIFYSKNLVWGDANLTWGDPSVLWEYDKTLDEWRRFPTMSLRSQFRQIVMQPGYVVTNKYDDYPDGSFASALGEGGGTASIKILTPVGFSAITWPLNIVGQTISFDFDDYSTSYTITALSSGNTILGVSDPAGALAALPTNMQWQISGFLKEQRFQLSGYDITFGYMGQRGSAGTSGQGGGNGTK